MALNIRSTRVLINTTTGNQDITIPGFGTPKAARFFLLNSGTDDSVQSDAETCIGFTDGTNQASMAVSSVSGLSTSDTDRASTTNRVYRDAPSSGAIAAEFVQWITDGVRINLTAASLDSRYLIVEFWGGSDLLNAKVDTVRLASTSNTINTVGFEPTIVYITTIGNSSIGQAAHSIFSQGYGLNDGTDLNRAVLSFDENSQSTTDSGTSVSVTRSTGQYFNNGTTWVGTIENYTASGFDINTNASTGNDWVSFIALEISSNYQCANVDKDSPTSTGTYSFDGAGFTPSYLFALPNHNTVNPGVVSDYEQSIFIANASEQYSATASSIDNLATSEANSLTKSGGLATLDGNSKRFDSTFTGFTSDGADFNFSTVDATARKWFGLFIGPVSSGITVTVQSLAQSQVIDNVTLTENPLLSINPVAQSQTIGNVDLIQNYTLSISDISQSQTLDNITLTQAGIVVLNEVTQVQLVEQLTLQVMTPITVQNLSQSQLLDNINITLLSELVQISDATQQQTIDNITLLQHSVIQVDSLSQNQLLQSINFGGVVVGYLEGELNIFYSLNGDILVYNAVNGETKTYNPLDGSTEILG